MPTVVVTSRPIVRMAHGYDLRVANLCQQIDDPQHLVAIDLQGDASDDLPPTIDSASIFASVTQVEPDEGDRAASPLRHVRLSDIDYLRLAFPRLYARAIVAVRRVIERTAARRVVVFDTAVAGIVHAVGAPQVLLDVCDSRSMTYRRSRPLRRPAPSLRVRLSEAATVFRWRRCEGALPRLFSHVTAISDADRDEIRRCAGGDASNVHTIPNGVGPPFLAASAMPVAGQRRGVVFWGNLGFAPNREALRFFVDEVYTPRLRDLGIEVCVIGRGAEPWLQQLAAQDRRVRVLGFVDDLVSTIRSYPVMINPMVIGSGMKNKVLEAFAARLAVVSTRLGMDAIPDARSGVHYLDAGDAGQFAAAIIRLCDEPRLRDELIDNATRLVAERYTWAAVGREWRKLHEQLAEPAAAR